MEHNDKFLLRLVIQNDSYYIQLVDYDTIYNYSHQLSSSEITSFSIKGDVEVYYIHIHE